MKTVENNGQRSALSLQLRTGHVGDAHLRVPIAWLAVFVLIIFAGCGQISQKELDLYANKALQIKVPCGSAEWEAVTTVEQGGSTISARSGIAFRQGRYRIEIYDNSGENKQVILVDRENLYVLGYDNKAYKYPLEMRESEVFLRKVFVNTGTGRKPEMLWGTGVYNGQKCSVYEYDLLRNINGLYFRAKVREWRNKKGATVKMETNSAKSEFEISGAKVQYGPIKETYEVSNYKCGARLMGMLFEVPMGMEIVDYKQEYLSRLKKAGKEMPADAAGTTFTVK